MLIRFSRKQTCGRSHFFPMRMDIDSYGNSSGQSVCSFLRPPGSRAIPSAKLGSGTQDRMHGFPYPAYVHVHPTHPLSRQAVNGDFDISAVLTPTATYPNPVVWCVCV
ncbi:unnamed protein product, partial [Ectocarpus sp. 4 AP-2014]